MGSLTANTITISQSKLYTRYRFYIYSADYEFESSKFMENFKIYDAFKLKKDSDDKRASKVLPASKLGVNSSKRHLSDASGLFLGKDNQVPLIGDNEEGGYVDIDPDQVEGLSYFYL
jgi:hypothetical protein